MKLNLLISLLVSTSAYADQLPKHLADAAWNSPYRGTTIGRAKDLVNLKLKEVPLRRAYCTDTLQNAEERDLCLIDVETTEIKLKIEDFELLKAFDAALPKGDL